MTDGFDAPKLSVGIPYEEGRESIAFLLASVLRQTEGPSTPATSASHGTLHRNDVEVVIVNNRLDQDSRVFLDRLADRYGCVVHHNESRLDLSRNWSRVLSLVRGEVVTLMLPQDWYAPACFQVVLKAFQQSESLVLYAAGQAIFGGPTETVQVPPHEISGEFTGSDYAELMEGLRGFPAPSQTFLRRSSLNDADTLCDERYRCCPELDLYYRLAKRFPDRLFMHDPRVLICRGSHPGTHVTESMRIHDLSTFALHHLGDGRSHPRTVAAVELAQDVVCDRASRLLHTFDIFDIADFKVNRSNTLDVIQSESFWALVNRGYTGGGRLWRSLSSERQAIDWTPTTEILANAPGGTIAAPPSIVRNTRRASHRLGLAEFRALESRAEQIAASDCFNQPILICGFHHSGTRLLGELLDACGVFQVVNSPAFEWTYVQSLNSFILPDWAQPTSLEQFRPEQAAIRPDRNELAFRLGVHGYAGTTPWGHKDPRTCGTIGAWIDCFPRSRVIHMLRDPRDVIGTLPQSYGRFSPSGLLPQQDPEHWTRLWAASVDMVRRYRDGAAAYVEVTFEDLCRRPREALADIAQGAELAFDLNQASKQFDVIRSDRIGIHRAYLEDGRLDASHLETIVALAGDRWSRTG